MYATVLQPHCGPLRVVITRAPSRRLPGNGIYMPERVFTLEVALENVGDSAISSPISMRSERISLVKYGRIHDPSISRSYGELAFWHGQEMQQQWRFAAQSQGERVLAPGARSTSATITMVTSPLATGFILWLTNDAWSRPSSRADSTPRTARREHTEHVSYVSTLWPAFGLILESSPVTGISQPKQSLLAFARASRTDVHHLDYLAVESVDGKERMQLRPPP